jgi:coniferyl-aldehyde dehydrogenase
MLTPKTEHHKVALTASLAELLAHQRQVQRSLGFPSAALRRERLSRLSDMIENHRDEVINALRADFGQRSDFETQIADLLPVLTAVKHASTHLASWMRPEAKSIAVHFQPGRAQVHYHPVGVVGIISPWNFPVSLALSPAASAIAAGNSVMIKPSEFTPATSALLERLVGQYFDASELAVVTGDETVAKNFSALAFDHLLFTGATSVGKQVMRAASENLVPVTLELGGKSPVIIDHSYPLDKAAGSIAFGKFVNAGQICIAPDYCLVQREKVEDFVWAMKAAVQKMYPSLLDNNDYTSIINQKHFARITHLIEDARSKGARIIKINPLGENFKDQNSFKIAPTLVLGVDATMDIADEEIFGPVLPIVAYDTLDQAIAFVNARPRPLSLYVFSHHRDTQNKVLKSTLSGGVTINDTLQHYLQDNLPFGGIGPSGMGAYHGKDGFLTFSHKRSVFVQSRLNGAGLLRAPYGGLARLILKFMAR